MCVCVCPAGWRCQKRLQGFKDVPPRPKHSRLLLSPLPSCPPISSLRIFPSRPRAPSPDRPPSDPAPAPGGQARPPSHPTPLSGEMPRRARRTQRGRDPSGACRTRGVQPGPALSSTSAPTAEARSRPRPPSQPGFACPRCVPRARPFSGARHYPAPSASLTHQGVDQGPAPAPGSRCGCFPSLRPPGLPGTPPRARQHRLLLLRFAVTLNSPSSISYLPVTQGRAGPAVAGNAGGPRPAR